MKKILAIVITVLILISTISNIAVCFDNPGQGIHIKAALSLFNQKSTFKFKLTIWNFKFCIDLDLLKLLRSLSKAPFLTSTS